MNIYDQLKVVRTQVESRKHAPETLPILDRLIAQAEPERNNPLSVSFSMVVRHLLRQRAVLDNESVYLDILGLTNDQDDPRGRRDADLPDATEDVDQRPKHLPSFYKKQKEKEKLRRHGS